MVNPARAGMIPRLALFHVKQMCKPRASGDDPKSVLVNYAATNEIGRAHV